MSLFNKDLVKKNISFPGEEATCVGGLVNRVINYNNLWPKEKDYLKFFYDYIPGGGVASRVPIVEALGVQVEISDKKPCVSSCEDIKRPIDPYVINGGICVLGEYYQSYSNEGNPRILLYIKNIRDAAEMERHNDSGFLLISVLAHELCHAYFQKRNYILEIEEPMAEYGSLLYMNSLRGGFVTEENVNNLYNMIAKKNTIGSLKYYSLGSELFNETISISNNDIREYFRKFKKYDLTKLEKGGDKHRAFESLHHDPTVENLKKLFE